MGLATVARTLSSERRLPRACSRHTSCSPVLTERPCTHGAENPRDSWCWKASAAARQSVLGAATRRYAGAGVSCPGAAHAPARAPTVLDLGRRIDELIRRTRRPVLVGHSFGASVLLKYLAETVRRPTPAGLFLVAMPFWGPDFPEFALPPDFGVRLRDLSPIFLYHSLDDADVPIKHLQRYRRLLPHATVRVLDGRGHEFNQAQFPELAADIRGLALRRAV